MDQELTNEMMEVFGKARNVQLPSSGECAPNAISEDFKKIITNYIHNEAQKKRISIPPQISIPTHQFHNEAIQHFGYMLQDTHTILITPAPPAATGGGGLNWAAAMAIFQIMDNIAEIYSAPTNGETKFSPLLAQCDKMIREITQQSASNLKNHAGLLYDWRNALGHNFGIRQINHNPQDRSYPVTTAIRPEGEEGYGCFWNKVLRNPNAWPIIAPHAVRKNQSNGKYYVFPHCLFAAIRMVINADLLSQNANPSISQNLTAQVTIDTSPFSSTMAMVSAASPEAGDRITIAPAMGDPKNRRP